MKKTIRLTESDLIKLVKRVLNEQKKTVVKITDSSQVPQTLVDSNPAPLGRYTSMGKGKNSITIEDENGVEYEIDGKSNETNYVGNNFKGYIEADYNSAFFQTRKLIPKFGYRYDMFAQDIVPNTKDKWIGFDATDFGFDIKFACFKTNKGKFECHNYKWVSP